MLSFCLLSIGSRLKVPSVSDGKCLPHSHDTLCMCIAVNLQTSLTVYVNAILILGTYRTIFKNVPFYYLGSVILVTPPHSSFSPTGSK